MEGVNGPASVTAGLIWAIVTWLDPTVIAGAATLLLATLLISVRFSTREVPLRGMAFAALVGALAHLFAGGPMAGEVDAAASAAVRLAALFAEGRFIYLLTGPSRLAAGVEWLARPMRVLGVRSGEMRLMTLVVLRLLPEARRVLRRVVLGRRYLGIRFSPAELGRIALAWMGGVLESAGAIGENLVLRGFGNLREGRPEAISWRALTRLSALPLSALVLSLPGVMR